MPETSEYNDPRSVEPSRLLLPTAALSRRFETTIPGHDGRSQEFRDRVAERRRGFRVGTIGLVPEAGTLCEIIERPRIYPVPNSVSACLGMMNLRGMLIPVFSVHSLLGAGVAEEAGRWFIVMGEGQASGAIGIDGLPVQVDLLPEAKITTVPPLPEIMQSQVKAGYQFQGELWFEIDHVRFLEAVAECRGDAPG